MAKNPKKELLEHRIETLYHRYTNYLIIATDLLNSLSLAVAEEI
jgi:hypothetical protein